MYVLVFSVGILNILDILENFLVFGSVFLESSFGVFWV